MAATSQASGCSLVSPPIDVNTERSPRQRSRSTWLFFALFAVTLAGSPMAPGHTPSLGGERTVWSVEDEVAPAVIERDRSRRSLARRALRGVRWRPRRFLLSPRHIVRSLRRVTSAAPGRFQGHFEPPLRGPPSDS